MPLSSASNLTNATASSNVSSVTTASISPTANGLLIVSYSGRNNATFTINSISDTLTGTGTWTIYQTIHFDGTRYSASCIAVAQAGSSPGSGTVTVTLSGNVSRHAYGVSEVTGHDTTTPVVQNANNTGAGATLTVTQSATPATTSLVFGNIADANGGATTGVGDANYTELYDIDSGGGGTQITGQIMYDLANADTTTDWNSLAALSNAGVAVEIAEAAIAGTDPYIPLASRIRAQRFASYIAR